VAISTVANTSIEIERVILRLGFFCLASKIAVSQAFADETLKPRRGIPLALVIIKEFASEKGVENMKKIALAVLLGLTALSSMISLFAPVSFAQEEPAPAPEPKPEKPGE
jgi:hypothetical protein